MELYRLVSINNNLLNFQNYNDSSHYLEIENNESYSFIEQNVYKLEINDNNFITNYEKAFFYKIIPSQDIIIKTSNNKFQIEFEMVFKTKFFNTYEEAYKSLNKIFINSSCNIMHSIKSIKKNNKICLESKIGVYYLEKYSIDENLSIKFENLFNENLNMIKNNIKEVLTVKNKVKLKSITIISIIFSILFLISLNTILK